VSSLSSPVLQSLQPYVAGEQPQDKKYIKLNTNENPYAPSSQIANFLTKINYQELKLYPDPDARKLCQKIACYHKIEDENIFIGNGSDEVLALCFYSFFKQKNPILLPDITYSFYQTYAKFFEINIKTINLTECFSIDFAPYLNQKSGGIIFSNPNAPTGLYKNIESIEALLKTYQKKVVIIDEAYIDFGGESAISLIKKYNNLIIVRTLSKSRSLAGIRIGYAIGDKNLIKAMQVAKNSFNSYPTNYLSQKIATISFDDDAYFKETIKKIIKNRELLTRELLSLSFNVIESSSNFVFASPHTPIKANYIYQKLKDNKILVRHFDKHRIDNFLRITVGKPTEIRKFINELKIILKNA